MAVKRRRRRQQTNSDPPIAAPLTAPTWLPWAVFGVALLVFLPAAGNEFVNFDDDRNFLENPHYRGFSAGNLRWMLTNFHLGHYHPVTWLTLGIDYSLWGMNPAGYHFTNALLHALAALLVFFVLCFVLKAARRTTQTTAAIAAAAAVGALFFALHPLRVESVAWISERRDVLSGVFYLLALWFYLKDRKAASLAAFAAALLSKVIAATLPVVLLIVDLYPLRRRLSLRLMAEKIPYFALSLVASLIGVGRYEAGVSGALEHAVAYSPLLRLTMSLYGLVFYLWKTVLPFGLSPQYVFDPHPEPFSPRLLMGSLAAMAITAAAFWMWRRRPYFLAAWAAYSVTLLPVLSLLRLDTQQYVADHHSYLASIPLAALLAGGWAEYSESWPRRRQWVAAISLLAVLAGLTLRQIRYWESSEVLWARALETSPLSVTAHNNFGRALADKGQLEEAIERFRRAVEIDPLYAHAQYNLGHQLMQRGNFAEAETHLRAAVEREPGNPQSQNALANVLTRQERIEEALPHYKSAITRDPGYADAHYNLALALHRLGRLEQAEQAYASALAANPRLADAHNNWGVLLEGKGDIAQAIEHYRGALEIEPGHADARRNLEQARALPATP